MGVLTFKPFLWLLRISKGPRVGQPMKLLLHRLEPQMRVLVGAGLVGSSSADELLRQSQRLRPNRATSICSARPHRATNEHPSGPLYLGLLYTTRDTSRLLFKGSVEQTSNTRRYHYLSGPPSLITPPACITSETWPPAHITSETWRLSDPSNKHQTPLAAAASSTPPLAPAASPATPTP